MDEDFHTNYNISTDLTQMQIIELRGEYAKDCLDDKKFVFGKYTVSDDGNVWTSISLQFNDFTFCVGPKVTSISKQSYFTSVCIFLQVHQGCKPRWEYSIVVTAGTLVSENGACNCNCCGMSRLIFS